MERMRLLRTISYAPFIIAGGILLTSCTNNAEVDPNANISPIVDTNITTMEPDAVIDYTTPDQLARIIVDRDGYSTQEVKYAWIVADLMPAEFSVINDDSDEVVLNIVPEAVKYDSEANIYTAKLNFSDITTEGKYHIYESSLGQSYSFSIEKDYYIKRFDVFLATEYEKCEDGSATAEEVYSLIYIGERYSISIAESEKLWGAVEAWLDAAETDALSSEDTGLYSVIFAKASFNYSNTDAAKSMEDASNKASDWIKKAEELYSEIANREGELEQDTKFLALAELYRVTGKQTYGNAISDMYDEISALEDIHTSRKYLYGSMCYMNTHRTVNRNLCDVFMQSLLMSCEDISWDKTLLAPQNAERTPTDVILDYAQQLIAMNYVLDGYQYNELVVSIDHYMSGRNYEGYICNVEEEYSADAIVILSWLALLEKNGKLDPSAPVEWEYSW